MATLAEIKTENEKLFERFASLIKTNNVDVCQKLDSQASAIEEIKASVKDIATTASAAYDLAS